MAKPRSRLLIGSSAGNAVEYTLNRMCRNDADIMGTCTPIILNSLAYEKWKNIKRISLPPCLAHTLSVVTVVLSKSLLIPAEKNLILIYSYYALNRTVWWRLLIECKNGQWTLTPKLRWTKKIPVKAVKSSKHAKLSSQWVWVFD